ncbi:MAG: hypothetical protein AB7I68_10370 [Porticoccaceae bacterium]
MKLIRYCLRPLPWLVIGCGLLGLPTFGQAQSVTVTPAVPEAYQPFTIEWFEGSAILANHSRVRKSSSEIPRNLAQGDMWDI